MKRFPILAIVASMFVLSGCVVEFVDPVPTPSFTVTEATFSTNHSVDLGANGETGQTNQPEFVICDNLPTELIYRFSYTGSLSSFRSFLRGEDTGAIPPDGDRTFSAAGLGNPIEVRYSIPARLAPRLLAPNAIVPIGIVGYSRLYLDFPGTSQDKVSRRIAIIENCQ
jgi:hypothetical protein